MWHKKAINKLQIVKLEKDAIFHYRDKLKKENEFQSHKHMLQRNLHSNV